MQLKHRHVTVGICI